MAILLNLKSCYVNCNRSQDSWRHRPCSHLYFYPTRVPLANGTRQVAHVHTASTASTASGSSGTRVPDA